MNVPIDGRRRLSQLHQEMEIPAEIQRTEFIKYFYIRMAILSIINS